MMRPLCKGLVTSERMGATADVRVRNMCTIKTGPFICTVKEVLLVSSKVARYWIWIFHNYRPGLLYDVLPTRRV